MKKHSAFTMIELVFVIVIMGILGKFGVEFLFQAYNSFIFSKINNELQTNSAVSLEFIASRLQYRIKDSTIGREDDNTTFASVNDLNTSKQYTALEWIAMDIDGYRSSATPNWSAIIDLDNTSADKDHLISPGTDTDEVSSLINILSYGNSDINDSAIYFIGSNSDINGYGWNGTQITDQTKVMHPIKSDSSNSTILMPRGGDFSGIDVYEYYQLAWTANAVRIENINNSDNTFRLEYYWDYRPWEGETYLDGKHSTIMEDISTFRFTATGSIIKIQVCAKTSLTEEKYSLCKEKTVF